jgi:4-amino-4-deoxy-L-arabinose transferase-like glycosyltransferase
LFGRKITHNKKALMLILLLSIGARVYTLMNLPLHGDEAVYAEIIDEFIKKPTFLPNFLGHVISWKPPLTFIVYSFFIRLFNLVIPGAPVEITYRLPSLIFGVLSVLTFYFLVRKLYDEELAFTSALIFSTFPVFLFTNSLLLVDNLLIFLIILSLLFYLDGEKNRRYFYYGGFIAASAFWTKTLFSLMIPPIIIAYYYDNKKILFSKEFIYSLLLLPAGALIYTVLFSFASPRGYDLFYSYLFDFGTLLKPLSFGSTLPETFLFLYLCTSPWILIMIFSSFRINYKTRQNRMMLIWFLFTALIIFRPGFFWYYASVTPAIAFLSASTLFSIKNRNQIYIILIVFLYTVFASYPPFVTGYTSNPLVIYSEKQAGQFLQNKTDILVLADRGLTSLVFYKFHDEEKPNFNVINMTITGKSDVLTYIVYDTIYDQLKNPEKKEITIKNGTDIKNAILKSKINNYVVLNKNNYNLLLNDFPQNYKIVFNPINTDIVILEKIR